MEYRCPWREELIRLRSLIVSLELELNKEIVSPTAAMVIRLFRQVEQLKYQLIQAEVRLNSDRIKSELPPGSGVI